jgi:hypothetical protein
MPIDIYLRPEQDPNYNSNFIEVQDELSIFIQMIEMILVTVPGEILGEPNLGVNLEGFLWNPNITIGTIKNEIAAQIRRYCIYSESSIPVKIDVSFIRGDLTDGILVDIIVDGTKVLGVVASPRPDQVVKLNT